MKTIGQNWLPTASNYQEPRVRALDLRSRGICSASKGSYINDAGEEEDDIFGE